MPVHTMNLFFSLLALASLATAGGLILLAVARQLSPAFAASSDGLVASIRSGGLRFAALVAAVAMLGSLYYSEVAGFEPCKLCWYQRIAMYPLAVVLGIASFRGDLGIRRYAFPLIVAGGSISVYHYLLQNIPDLGPSGCSVTAPCSAAYVWQFGFISIPFMALSAFVLIGTLLASVGPSDAVAMADELEGSER